MYPEAAPKRWRGVRRVFSFKGPKRAYRVYKRYRRRRAFPLRAPLYRIFESAPPPANARRPAALCKRRARPRSPFLRRTFSFPSSFPAFEGQDRTQLMLIFNVKKICT
ncbi:hypothetical protein EVAR_14569_1 [Eumeta japonica]|uniref:Uncharacterized protein n=1 Tax=Eumeta variegata TaxID=151549 RepID=A0A4C1UVN7_EUMVA|nr:hypothetical protein EVAR_14569_1 [Eumeta japonica]